MNILFIGDIVGKPGRHITSNLLPILKEKYKVDYTIANGENSAGGYGITPDIAKALIDMGVDFITTGNHIWEHKEIIPFLSNSNIIIRPYNIAVSAPGNGFSIISKPGLSPLAIINLIGRVFMPPAESPFYASIEAVDKVIKDYPKIKHIIIDFHAEATSEKQALGWYLDGKVTCVLGTHTHVQTSDEKILPHGTAYITDVGMTGVVDGILGMDKEQIISRFITSVQKHADVATGMEELQAVLVTTNEAGKSEAIIRIKETL